MSQLSRSIIKNLVIAAAMSITALASWAVTVIRNPAVGVTVVNSCYTGQTLVVADATDDDTYQCRLTAGHG
jgi:hypothetical protein